MTGLEMKSRRWKIQLDQKRIQAGKTSVSYPVVPTLLVLNDEIVPKELG